MSKYPSTESELLVMDRACPEGLGQRAHLALRFTTAHMWQFPLRQLRCGRLIQCTDSLVARSFVCWLAYVVSGPCALCLE